jgi:hypothetical protein
VESRKMMSAKTSTFEIAPFRGVWRVTQDGAFYGDYRARDHATEGAEAAAVKLRGQGRVVKIIAPPEPA